MNKKLICLFNQVSCDYVCFLADSAPRANYDVIVIKIMSKRYFERLLQEVGNLPPCCIYNRFLLFMGVEVHIWLQTERTLYA